MAIIAIDPGHGTDTWERTGGKGVTVNGNVYEEHDFNARLTIRLKEVLELNGHEIIIVQKPFEKEVALIDRTNKYNSLGVDIVISLHANAGPASANGSCIFYWHSAQDAKSLANSIISQFNNKHGNGLHAAIPGTWTNLHICRETVMTAILIENGFMTNSNDFEKIFKSDKFIIDRANSIGKGLQNYLGLGFKEKKEINNELYRVRLTWEDNDSQIGAYSILENAKDVVNKNPKYKVFDSNGKLVYRYVERQESIDELKEEIERLKKLNRQIQEERDKYKNALIDIDERIEEDL